MRPVNICGGLLSTGRLLLTTAAAYAGRQESAVRQSAHWAQSAFSQSLTCLAGKLVTPPGSLPQLSPAAPRPGAACRRPCLLWRIALKTSRGRRKACLAVCRIRCRFRHPQAQPAGSPAVQWAACRPQPPGRVKRQALRQLHLRRQCGAMRYKGNQHQIRGLICSAAPPTPGRPRQMPGSAAAPPV